MSEHPVAPVATTRGSSMLVKVLIGLIVVLLILAGLWWWQNRPIRPVVLSV